MNTATEAEVLRRARCFRCGSAVRGSSCGECGMEAAPRAEIRLLAGVNNNFGTVNNVYNIGQPEPEIFDSRDVQDVLNERFPERIPVFSSTPERKALPPGPSSVVRVMNGLAVVLGVGLALVLLALIAAVLLT